MKLDFTEFDKLFKCENEMNSTKPNIKNDRLDRIKAEIEKAKEVYGIHQENIKISETLQAEILKGVKNKEEL